MTASPEYPDLRWMPPKAWTRANRTSVQLVVIHVTDGAARASAAEDGAAYDQRRTDGTSTHYFHDSDSTIQCVRTEDRAHAARAQGNIRGIQHELCTRADGADWADTYHQAMLRRVAKQAARDARKWKIPVRHLTVAQVAGGEKGFCGHVDVTRAFPQDRGTHTDPGGAFPWTQFLTMVRAELDPTDLEDDMPTTAEIAEAIWSYKIDSPALGVTSRPASDWLKIAEAARNDLATLSKSLTAAIQAVAAKQGVQVTDEQLQSAVLGALKDLAAKS